MKKKSVFARVFAQVMLLIGIALACILLTVCLALLAGSADTFVFDWKNLNLSNMMPVLIIGAVITGLVVGISAVMVLRSSLGMPREYLIENSKSNTIYR